MGERPGPPSPGAGFGFETLEPAVRYRRALVEAFRPHLGREVLEIGAGIGQITELLVRQPGVERVHAVEPDPAFCARLRARLPEVAVTEGDASCCPLTAADAIVSVNVLEHLVDDTAELRRYARLLAPRRGALCLFVPARPELYAPLDRAFGHHRRYTRPELVEKLRAAGFPAPRVRYCNLLGYLGWGLLFRALGREKLDAGAVRLFDRAIFPVGHWLESHLGEPPVGQSLLAIARP